jgi:2-oxoglutarate ferredoxin oxidoreductase subunit alpha
MRLNILFGGPAGTGPNILTHILGEALVKQGYFVFYSRDYQSLIRGGHNFNVLTFSDKSVYSNDKKIDILIALDQNTEKVHKEKLEKEGIILNGEKENMYFAGALFKVLGLDFKILEEELKELKKRFK